MPASNHSKQILIGNFKTQSHVLCTSLFLLSSIQNNVKCTSDIKNLQRVAEQCQFRCQFWVNVSRFSPCLINKIVCCRLRKAVAKSTERGYFEQQIFTLWLVFHQSYNLSRNKFTHVARQVEGFCISYFAAFTLVWVTGR